VQSYDDSDCYDATEDQPMMIALLLSTPQKEDAILVRNYCCKKQEVIELSLFEKV
jgi:hypothetical protein